MSGPAHGPMLAPEHDVEPALGLPEPLPGGEQVLWQGAPAFGALARRAFHVRSLALYFGVILVLRAAHVLSQGQPVREAAIAVVWLLPLVIAAVGLMTLLAWLASRTTLYTVTNKRVVMRIGIVLSITFNLPYRRIESAGLRRHADGTGDIPLVLGAGDRIAFVHLWPHARPWRVSRTEPMLRCVPQAEQVAQILSRAWAEVRGVALAAAPVATAGDGAETSATAAGRKPRPAAPAEAATRHPRGASHLSPT